VFVADIAGNDSPLVNSRRLTLDDNYNIPVAWIPDSREKPHPSRGWSHHTTHDHIIDVNGDDATLDAQFVVFEVRGKERSAAGWPEGAFGAQGTVQPVEAGYYRPILCRVDGVWKITTMRITHNISRASKAQNSLLRSQEATQREPSAFLRHVCRHRVHMLR
jgi:hypothetical protein